MRGIPQEDRRRGVCEGGKAGRMHTPQGAGTLVGQEHIV